MKKVYSILLVFALAVITRPGQGQVTSIKLRGTRLAYPLMNAWIADFRQLHPEINVTVAPQSPADSIDFTIASYSIADAALPTGQQRVAVADYVQVLIVNSHHPQVARLQQNGITEKEMGELFFSTQSNTFAAAAPSLKAYVRDRPVCAVKAFASHYDVNVAQLKGTPTQGDDLDLAMAVSQDINGMAFNNLGFIYNLHTRKVKEALAVIPIDKNSNGTVDREEQHYDHLDDLLAYIAQDTSDTFVRAPVNVLFEQDLLHAKPEAYIFLHWVLTHGQQRAPALGFLPVKERLLQEQLLALQSLLPASKASCEAADQLMRNRKVTLKP